MSSTLENFDRMIEQSEEVLKKHKYNRSLLDNPLVVVLPSIMPGQNYESIQDWCWENKIQTRQKSIDFSNHVDFSGTIYYWEFQTMEDATAFKLRWI